MDFLYAYPPPPPISYLHLGDTRIPVYEYFPLDQHLHDRHYHHADHFTITQLLCLFHPLPYPFTWFVVGNHEAAIVVNCNDLLPHYATAGPPSFLPRVEYTTHPFQNAEHDQSYVYHPVHVVDDEDEVFILDDVEGTDRFVINERFDQAAAASHVTCNGLTKKRISKNLRVTKYREEEEEGEICVVCQVEFERGKRVAVLQCKHRYHPRCIKEWLVRQNVCPICKSEGLSV